MDKDTAPPAGSGEGATPLSEIIGADRHKALETHEVEREVGGAPMGATEDQPSGEQPAGAPKGQPAPAAAAAPSAQPAKAVTAPPQSSAQAAPAGQAGEQQPAPREPDPNDPNSPRWYRDHMRKVNRELAELRARAGEAPAPQGGQQPQPRGGPQAQPQTVRLPDPREDPEGYHRAVMGIQQAQLNQIRLENNLARSEDRVRGRHGDETFEDLKAWLGTQSDELEDFFTRQPDPWGAALAHYQRETLAQEIGDDPAAWREREKARMREELLSELNAEAAGAESQHIPAQRPMRPTPPPPASQARSAQARDPAGRFQGPTPLSGALKHGHRR